MNTTEAWVRPARRGPVEGENVIGVDAELSTRPGVPMTAFPTPSKDAPEGPPEQQENGDGRLHRAALDGPTPVFGTGQPPHGVSGTLRRAAYRRHEHYARHWLLLFLADRVDVLEGRMGGMLSAPLRAAHADSAAERVRSNPLPVLGGVLLGAVIANRLLRLR